MPYCTVEEAWGVKQSDKSTHTSGSSAPHTLQYAPFSSTQSKTNLTSRDYTLLPEHSESQKRVKNLTPTSPYNSQPERLQPTCVPFTELRSKDTLSMPQKSLQDLVQENSSLRQRIESLEAQLSMKTPVRNQEINTNDNIFDLLLFIFAGVFILFFLDMITKSIPRSF